MEKYTNLQELGQGAFGKVYKAECEEDGSTHALKCLTVDSIDKGQVVLKEIHALQQVGEHPNILQFTEVFTENGLNTPVLTVWLVLDYCSGGTLDGFISAHNPDRATVLQLLCGTAEGVAYLHGRNVVHGALKPDNILVNNSGKLPIVKIADFGIVRVCEQGGWDISNYHRQTANGTRMYLSPEIIIGVLAQRPDLVRYTAEADVFALGLIIAAILDQTTDPTVPATSSAVPATDLAVPATDPAIPATDSTVQATDPAVPATDPAVPATDLAVPATDPTVPATDPAVPATDPTVPATDLAVSATDPAKPGKLVPAVYVNGQPTAIAEIMITKPGYPVADMLMTSEPPTSPLKTLVLAMLATNPQQRPTSEQVLGILRQITNSPHGTIITTPLALPPQPPHIVVEVPADSSGATPASCCAACWRCDPEHDWYNIAGKGCGWVILLILMYVIGVLIIIAIMLCLICFVIYTGTKIPESNERRPSQVSQVTNVHVQQLQQSNAQLQQSNTQLQQSNTQLQQLAVSSTSLHTQTT
ncbi:uncharacterized protein [Branchiostoma lanceolatum]|uniref:uncharacterized protein isoform X2 n=1 Tax=Branchiostoma lanceolatum TaxID=7740 RepID=UPI003453E09E